MSHCTPSNLCPDGNCTGCRNGQLWCADPRCEPYCKGCPMPYDHDYAANVIVAVILLALVIIFIILWYVYGPPLIEAHSDHQRAGVIMPCP